MTPDSLRNVFDPARLTALRRTGLMDSGATESFDRLARLAGALLDAPMALLTLVDRHRQYFKGACGLPEPWARRRETPLSHSLCKHVVATGAPLIVEDVREHSALRDNPAIPVLNAVAYAGVPLADRRGFVLGSLCVIDSRRRRWSERQVVLLTDLACSVMTEIELMSEVAAGSLTAERIRRLNEEFAAWAAERGALLDSLLGSAPVVVAFVGPDRRYLRVSDGLAKLHGAPRETLAGCPVAQVLPDLWPQLEPIYARVLDHGETITNVELHDERPGRPGEPTYWLANYYPVSVGGKIIAAGVILVDITERKRAGAAVRESEKRLAYALEASTEGLWDWNIKTGTVYFNPHWIESLGYSPSEVPLHVSFWEGLVHPDDMPRVREVLLAHFEGRTPLYMCEYRLRMKSGEYRWNLDRGRVVEWEADGKPLRMIGTDTDITGRRQAEEELRRLNATLESRVAERTRELAAANRELAKRAEALERSLQFKSEFLANMSHELRTPLNSLLILSRLLIDNPGGNLTDNQVNFARTIHGCGEDLLRLIDDVLDFAKIESGTLSFHYEQMAFAEVIRPLERTFRPVAQSKGLDFTTETAPGLPEALETDPKRLQQVLTNLLSNAFKFTARGQVSMRVYPAVGGFSSDHPDLSRARNVVAFAVNDTGIGIASEKQNVIFEAFRQADTGATRPYSGTGLGLAICRQLLAKMGGEIRLASEPGKGSTFTVFLPLSAENPTSDSSGEVLVPVDERGGIAAGDHVELRRPALPVPPAVYRGRKVLVVDDDVRNLYSISAVLEAEGYEVITAGSGETALEKLAGEPEIDCVLMDIMMPGMDGLEATRRIRAQSRFEHLPVIAVTAKAMPGDRQKCIEAGCSDYLAKPVDAGRLLAMIEQRVAAVASR